MSTSAPLPGRVASLDVLGTRRRHSSCLCGITDILGEVSAENVLRPAHASANAALPAEMGELFKVIALGRHYAPLLRFRAATSYIRYKHHHGSELVLSWPLWVAAGIVMLAAGLTQGAGFRISGLDMILVR